MSELTMAAGEIVSMGQYTIVDYNDAVTLTGFIGSNKPTVQQFNPDNGSYTPTWVGGSFMVLTPSLFLMGTSSDIIASAAIQSIKWYDGAAPSTELVTGGSYVIPAFASGSNRPLTINANILVGATVSKVFICEIVYKDPTSLLDLVYKTSITLSKVTNGGGLVNAVVTTPGGYVFKNDTSATLTAEAALWRGGLTDTTLVEYRWYIDKVGAVTDGIGGAGWEYITTGNVYGITGFATNSAVLTIPSTAVLNIKSFKVVIKDTDAASVTLNQYFHAPFLLLDQTDPIQIFFDSSAGSVFKNGVGSTNLKAILFRNGVVIDNAGTIYTYKWAKKDKNGVLDTTWGNSGYKTTAANILPIDNTEVDAKATFNVEILTKS